MDVREKYQKLKTLREEEPLVWCVVRGARGVHQMAKMLLWTQREIREQLADEVDIILDGNRCGLNEESPRWVELFELESFAKDLFVKIAAKERADKVASNELTDKQQTFYELLVGMGQFTTRDAAEVQGLSRPGFTQNQLMALVKKGKVRELGGRPKRWETIA